MRVHCEFKNKAIGADVEKVVPTLFDDIQIVPERALAEMIITDCEYLILTLRDLKIKFVLATFADLKTAPDNAARADRIKVLVFTRHYFFDFGMGEESLDPVPYEIFANILNQEPTEEERLKILKRKM